MAALGCWMVVALLAVVVASNLPEKAAAADKPKGISFSTPPWDSFKCSYPSTVDLPASTVCRVLDDGQLILSDDNDVISVRSTYKKKVQLYKKKTKYAASFSTQFTINIDRDSERSVKRVFGGGIAFAFTPNTDVGTSGAESFGLFEIDPVTGASLRGKKTKTVAVAIDLSRTTADGSTFDPVDIPHVELDVNSVDSVKTSYLWNGTDFIDRKIGVFVDYDAKKELLEVRFQNVSSTGKPDKKKSKLYLSYSGLRLSDYLNEKSYVALSSRAPVTTDGIYRIYNWKFSTKFVSTSKVH